MWRDTLAGTFTVAAVLCVACSVIVSGAAVGLRPIQDKNKALFTNKNVLIAAGLVGKDEKVSVTQIEERMESVRALLIDIDTGEQVEATKEEIANYDAKAVSKTDEAEAADGLKSIANRAPYARVYEMEEGGKVTKVILPIYGKGLWSTAYGFLALERDGEGKLNKVAGITFYEHKETPGLGGEVENKTWQGRWNGKLVRGDDGTVQLGLIKGTADPDSPHDIDGLSGATITSNGVTNTIEYWLGDDAFGKYLKRIE